MNFNPIELAHAITKQGTYFWKIRGSLRSLITFLIFLNIIFIPLLLSPIYFVLSHAELISTPHSFLRFAFSVAGAIGLVNLGLIIAWFYWRSPPKISPPYVGVFFAPYAEDDVTREEGNVAWFQPKCPIS